jgi:pimeloyl-ACP methyl ester carboxylesterase
MPDDGPSPAPDPTHAVTLAVEVPGHPGTHVRVEVHNPRAATAALVSSGLGLPLELWYPVVAQLPEVCLVLVDRPGLGGSSPWAHPPAGLAEQVGLLDSVLDAVVRTVGRAAHSRVVAVGHSYGGLLAEAHARQRPDRIGALVLVDPSDPAHEAAHGSPPRGALALADRLLVHDSVAGAAARSTAWLTEALGSARRQPPEVARRLRAQHATPQHLRASLAELGAIGSEAAELLSLRAAHPRLEVPAELLIARSRGLPPHLGRRRWIRQMSSAGSRMGARATVVDGAHLLMVDDPAAVAAAIRRAAQAGAAP